jgi:alanine-glyoxylate transaminase / serine-glyoxylate transaminase / serine-pyruvate transaminase
MALRLMIPGPTDVSDSVLAVMGEPVRAHYGAAWLVLHRETIAMLRQIIGTTGKIFMLPGSGSVGNDAALNSALRDGEKVVVGSNGNFGERLTQMVEGCAAKPIVVKADPGEQLSAQAFAAALRQHPDAALTAVVHLETSTGVLNPVRDIAAVSRAAGVPVMVDAVSSLGGTPLPMDEWGIDIVTSASQKCLGAPPGLAVVAVSDSGWPRVARPGARGWYMNLNLWQHYVEDWGDWHPHPVTMPSSIVAALHQSLTDLMAEGLEARQARYWRTARRLRTGLTKIGLPPVMPDEASAPVLTAAWTPNGVKSTDLVANLIAHHCIQITTGFGALKETVVRIGHMSNVTDAQVDELLAGIEEFLHRAA